MIDSAAEARELIESATGPGATESARERFAERWPEVCLLCSEEARVREELRDLLPPLADAQDDLDGAGWLALMLSVLHDEPFVAIEFPSRTGIAGRMSGVVDNFQLQTLLMDAIPAPRGFLGRPKPRVSAAAVANARGEGPQELGETIRGAWNAYTYRALRDRDLPPPDLDGRGDWIWNEGTPADIPVLDGHRVILLGPPAYVREWPASRVFPDLRADLDHRQLDAGEVEQWLDRIAAP